MDRAPVPPQSGTEVRSRTDDRRVDEGRERHRMASPERKKPPGKYGGARLVPPHQNRKYRWAIGSTRAGSHVRLSPSARTTYVSGSTSILGSASFQIMSRLPIRRHPLTAIRASIPPPALPGSGSRVGGGDRPLSPPVPRAPRVGRCQR